MTHIFPSFAFLPPFDTLGMSHFSSETGNIVVALLCVPLLSTLLATETKLLVFELPLGIGSAKTHR